MDERDLADLARVHSSCLPDSLVSALGDGYARSFYRYITRSSHEFALVERNQHGRIVAAAVISLQPATLTRRLVLYTSLVASVFRRPLPLLGLLRPGAPASVDSTLPEMILIYTSAEERGQGRASALIRQAEGQLRQIGVPTYQVRTELQASNPALAFYDKRGFVRSGTSVRLGVRFQVFTRTLSAD